MTQGALLSAANEHVSNKWGCRGRQPAECQAEPGTPSRALARPLTRVPPGGSAESGACVTFGPQRAPSSAISPLSG